MNILVVEDQRLYRDSLVTLLESEPGLQVVAEAGSYAGAVESALNTQPDLVLLDAHLPDGTSIEAIITLRTEVPHTRIICLAEEENHAHLVQAIRAGAQGYLLKNAGFSNLLQAIADLNEGDLVIPKDLTQRVLLQYSGLDPVPMSDSDLWNLTARERDVLRLICQNASNRAIAEQLVISPNTVRIHVHNILDKLNLKNRRAVRHKYASILNTEKSNSDILNF